MAVHRSRQTYVGRTPARQPVDMAGPGGTEAPRVLGVGNVTSPMLGSETSDFPVRHRGFTFLSRLTHLAAPARAGQARADAPGWAAMDSELPAPPVVSHSARLGTNAPIDANFGTGFPGNGSWLHLPHFAVLLTRAGRVHPMGPKTVSDTAEVTSTPVGGPLT